MSAASPDAAGRPLPAAMPVGAADLERELDRLRASAAGPEAGLFGPGSMLWRVDREAAVFLGAGRALLLQLAHPWVAAAVAEHSQTLADPVGRFHRTFRTTFTLVFGGLDQALEAARALHRRHGAIRGRLPEGAGAFAAGTPYAANEVAALRWVWATLTETALMTHDLLLPPLSGPERERYHADSLRFAALFGIPRAALPPDRAAFDAHMAAMLAEGGGLAVSPTARRVAEQVLSGAGRWWLRAPGWYRAVTARMLPPHLREGFGLPFGPAEARRAARALAWAGRVYPALPLRLRHVAPCQEAMARLRGRDGPDAVTRALNRLWIGQPCLGTGADRGGA